MNDPVASPEIDSGARRPLASPLHTIVLVLVLLAVSYNGSRSHHLGALKHGPGALYIGTIVMEWVLVGYIALGIRRRSSLRELIGGRWRTVADFLNDVLIAIGFWLVALVVLGAIGYALGLSKLDQVEAAKRQLGYILPRNTGQLLLFLCLSATAGFCEEIIFRGYLQRQFAAWTHLMSEHRMSLSSDTRSAATGLVLQALVFGASHAYEGPRRMLLIAVYGAMFGALALWRRSLRPGMMGHALHDGWTGTVLYFFSRKF
jgi:membrane protease YdiL (CAAX protease family)